jgi:hypothetical protein
VCFPSRHLLVFHDVNVAVLVEREHHGQHEVALHAVHGADRKAVRTIHAELRTA